MNSNPFFDLRHVFIVFQHGAGGNFLAGLISKVLNEDLSVPLISSTGSSHTVGNIEMSFGRTVEDLFLFPSKNDRIQKYLTSIEEKYTDIITPQVSWSHNFSNIKLYKLYFKNSIIISITANSLREKLYCILMQIKKNFLDLDGSKHWPISDNLKKIMWSRLETNAKLVLSKRLNPELNLSIDDIYNNRHDDKYSQLIEYVYIEVLLKFYGISIDQSNPNSSQDLFNNVVYTDTKNFYSRIIGPKISDLIKDCNVQLNVSDLYGRSYSMILNSVSLAINRPLSSQEVSFINNTIDQYISNQNSKILFDPIEYYHSIKNSVKNFIIK